MRRALWLVPIIALGVVGLILSTRPNTTNAQQGSKDPAAERSPATLPITQVVLFSSGVGYFQRTGQVEGSTRVDLTFQVRDINDLIKSLVLQDERGQVSAVSYDSFDPIERTLKSFAVNLTNNPSLSQILTQLRGEKVEVQLQSTAAAQPGLVTGSLIGVEKVKVAAGNATLDAEMLNLWCAEGVRSVRLTEIQRLRFLNPTIESEFRRALDTLSLSHDAQKKAVTLNFVGEGKRPVKVGYVVENPIWKTSYRLVMSSEGKPFLQGWAVVDNPTDEDWTNVGMALISGRPVSFQMDMYQPLYVPRPVVEPELFASLRPVAYGGAVATSPAVAPMTAAPGSGAVGGLRGGAAARRSAPADKSRSDPAEREELRKSMDDARSAGRELADQLERRMDLSLGVRSAATASQLGDFFRYVIDTPVVLPRQKSALLPIVNKEIDGTRLSIYNAVVHAKFPMLGLKVKNSSGLHLMQGPITVFEGSTYAGDARIQDVPPNDERLISYAVDLGTEVEAKSQRPADRLTSVRIERGLIIRTDKVREEMTYTATNRTDKARTLWIEHPYRPQFQLVSETKPVERTQEVYRFEMKLPAVAKQSVTQTIVEERDISTSINISNVDDNSIRFFINNTVSSAGVKKALQQAIVLKDALAKTQQELRHVNTQLQVINEDQTRLRANLREMPQTAAAYKRYLEKFDKQETEVETLRDQQKRLQAQELKDRQMLDSYLLSLNVK
jgi:hypothetical protein